MDTLSFMCLHYLLTAGLTPLILHILSIRIMTFGDKSIKNREIMQTAKFTQSLHILLRNCLIAYYKILSKDIFDIVHLEAAIQMCLYSRQVKLHIAGKTSAAHIDIRRIKQSFAFGAVYRL